MKTRPAVIAKCRAQRLAMTVTVHDKIKDLRYVFMETLRALATR